MWGTLKNVWETEPGLALFVVFLGVMVFALVASSRVEVNVLDKNKPAVSQCERCTEIEKMLNGGE